MKNIFLIFARDARRIGGNVVALVIVMGLTIIPALYAWFNILSNWDPYGESATSEMHVAVYSADSGISIGQLGFNIGDTVIEGLHSNTTIGWVFCDSKEEALAGVYSGEYYAALVIPDGFTTNMLSFLTGEPVNPTIEYYENSKKNAIATKITAKVKTAVQQTVNKSFVSTLTESVTKIGEVVTGNEVKSMEDLAKDMEHMSENLKTYEMIIDSVAMVTDSGSGILAAGAELIPDMEGMIDSTSDSLGAMQLTVLSTSASLNSMFSMVDFSMRQATAALDDLSTTIDFISTVSSAASNEMLNQIEKTQAVLQIALASVDWGSEGNGVVINEDALLNGITMPDGTKIAVTKEDLKALGFQFNEDGSINLGSDSTLGQVTSSEEYKAAEESYKKLMADVDKLQKDATATSQDIADLKKDIKSQITICKNAMKSLQMTFNYSILPAINQGVYKIEASLIEAQKLLNAVDNNFFGVEFALENYEDVLNQATTNLKETKEYIATIRGTVDKLAQAMKVFSEDASYNEIMEVLENDPLAIATYVTSPVDMNTVTLYEIKDYGSAMAPFYTVLAIWVGALIMVALVHVKVAEMPELKKVHNYQEFFGRYLTFFLIGQAQALIAVVGNLLFVQIQCMYPLLFLLACEVISMVFTMIMYGLTVAFGNIGQALAVIIMVIQVAGAGCTFPIEVLPQVFQSIYRVMPFYYAMNMLKACVGGIYKDEYWLSMAILVATGVLFMLIGLFLRQPFARLNETIERSKKKSGLLL